MRKALYIMLVFGLLSAGAQAQNWYIMESSSGWQGGEDAVYVPSEGWIVESEGVSSLSTQSASERWDTWYRVDESAREARVNLFPGSSASVLNVGNKTKIGSRGWRVEGSSQQIRSLKSVPEVFSVLPTHPGFVQTNQKSRELIGSDRVQTFPQNLTGDGFTAGVWDVGNSSEPEKALAGNHDDLEFRQSKVVAGEQNIQVGEHGTHVTGTLLGSGRTDSRRRGIAPNASAVGFVAPGSSLELFSETNKTINRYDGVVSQNSWGFDASCSSGVGDYDLAADSYDAYISNRSADVDGALTTVFAAGNKRVPPRFGGCTQKYNTSIPPATAKNIISVAALKNETKTASFSSTGPTDDGRIKPDISALGVGVNSTVPGDSYALKSGTSMAAPAISGAVVLLNEQFNETDRDPAPATTKGVLIHTAEDINLPGPDYLSGWGRADVPAAVNYVENSKAQNTIKTGSVGEEGLDTYSVEIREGEPLNATLVWSDPSAPSGSQETLVNDLDLNVTSSGERFYPWTINYSTRASGATRNKEDHTNNVERVYVPSAPAEDVNIEVQSNSIPKGPQDYTLLLTSAPDITIEKPSNSTTAHKPNISVLSSEALKAANFSLGGENTSLSRSRPRKFTNKSFNPPLGQSDLTVHVLDTDGERNSSSVTFTYDPFKPNLTVLSPEDNSSIRQKFDLNATTNDNITSAELSGEISTISGTVSQLNPNATVNAENLAEGKYNVTVSSTDAASNTATRNLSLRVDRTPPEIRELTPRIGSGNISVNASVSDASSVAETSFNLSNSTGSITGQLNQTLNTSLLEDGEYNLSLAATDAAGNKGENRTELKIDNTPPAIEFRVGSFLSDTFNTTLFVQDSTNTTTELTIKNSTFNRTLEPNSSASTSNLKQGSYTLEANVTDSANNSRPESIEVEVDRTAPNLAVLNPDNETTLTKDTEINATASDRETSVDTVDFTFKGAASRRSGDLNTTVDTRLLPDGDYTLNIRALDKAGNTNSTRLVTTIDNAPSIASTTIPQGGNVSGTTDINLSFRDASDIDTAVFVVLNTTGNQTNTKSVNTTLDTRELADGDYNISIQANDTKGNQLDTNISFTSDNTAPKLSLNVSEPDRSGYHRQNATAEINCSDQTSGVGLVNATPGPSSRKRDVNLTISQPGNSSIEFTCLDRSGNGVSQLRRVAIDSSPPKIGEVSPENLSTIGTDTDIQVEADDLSGLNTSDTQVSADGADASTSTDTDAINIQVSGAESGDGYTLELSMSDILNQSSTFLLRYETESEGDSGSSSRGGGGGGGGTGGLSTDAAETESSSDSEEEVSNETEVLDAAAQPEPISNNSEKKEPQNSTSPRNESQKPPAKASFQSSSKDSRLGTARLGGGDQLIEIPKSVANEEEHVLLKQLNGSATATAELVDSEGESLTYRTSATPAGDYAVVRDGEDPPIIPWVAAAAGILLVLSVGAFYAWRLRQRKKDKDLDHKIELLRGAINDSELSEEERQKASLHVQEALRHYRDGESKKAKEMLEQARKRI